MRERKIEEAGFSGEVRSTRVEIPALQEIFEKSARGVLTLSLTLPWPELHTYRPRRVTTKSRREVTDSRRPMGTFQ
jgi:hypothetical protein